jgi:uncharacterized protein YyaL (SSP411 family)
MERESFENEETARLMNELFVNIKVDREERPDVDNVYMTAAQAISGSGGWPLSAWLTPDLRPFYVGTYFPPRPMYGRPSFQDALRSLHDAWVNEREKVFRSAKAILRAVEKSSVIEDAGIDAAAAAEEGIIDRCMAQLVASYDPRHGGFSTSPKFPRPSIFEFLLRYHVERKNDQALEMVLHTMRKMAAGGMYDQLGGGFARYSVDAEWRVPHFEKMLYDQGQLLAVYADAYRITRDEELARVMRQTVDYLRRDLTDGQGTFYSAEDADSEGEEGTFYVWTLAELAGALEEAELDAVRHYFGITEEGNFEHGKNVLHTSATLEQVALRISRSTEEVVALLDSARGKLFAIRQKRVRPHRDEKILASWNGLMLSGLARAAAALDDRAMADMARRAADHLLSSMVIDGRLMHRMKDGEVKFDGYLDDYAFLAHGLLDLYETTLDVRYLKEADHLTRKACDLFWDEDGGGFFMTSGDDPNVLVRAKNDHDGAEPSGNSTMVFNLLRLGHLLDDHDLLAKGERTLRLFASRVAEYPIMMPLMAAAAVAWSHPPRQAVIVGSDDDAATMRLTAQVHARYMPDTAILFRPAGGADTWLAERAPLLEGMSTVEGRPALYLCENFVCHRPVTDLSDGTA